MKKLFSIVLVLISPLIITAQKGFSFGFDITLQHTGYTSWTNRKPFNQIFIKPGFGIHIEYYLTEWFGLESGLGINLYTQERSQFRNNFTYFSIPVLIKFNTPLQDKTTNELKSWKPAAFIGLNNALLLRAVHHSTNEKESINRFTEKYHYDIIGGIGIKIRIRDNLFLDNYIIASLGNPVNTKEHNSVYGTIINMNFGIKSSLSYSVSKPSI